jgi:hypothetical protein
MANKIPKYVTFFFQNTLIEHEELIVFPAFPKDPKTNCKTAINWAKGSYHNGCANNVIIKNELKSTILNEPIYNARIVDISYRGANAKVFKVIVHDKFLVDIGSEFLLDVIKNGKIEDGVIKSPMIFGVSGKFTLMMVGGKYYNDLEFESLPSISEKNLKPGYIYETSNHFVYYFGDLEECSIKGTRKYNHKTYEYEYTDATIEKKNCGKPFYIELPKNKKPSLYTLDYRSNKCLDHFYHWKLPKVKKEVGPFGDAFEEYLIQFEEWEWDNLQYAEKHPGIVKFLNHKPTSKRAKDLMDWFDSFPQITDKVKLYE